MQTFSHKPSHCSLYIGSNEIPQPIWDNINDKLMISVAIHVKEVFIKKDQDDGARSVAIDRNEWIKYNII